MTTLTVHIASNASHGGRVEDARPGALCGGAVSGESITDLDELPDVTCPDCKRKAR